MGALRPSHGEVARFVFTPLIRLTSYLVLSERHNHARRTGPLDGGEGSENFRQTRFTFAENAVSCVWPSEAMLQLSKIRLHRNLVQGNNSMWLLCAGT